MGRRVIVGIMGGNRSVGASAEEASEIGAAVVRSETILLTGGSCIANGDIKNAAMRGAKNECVNHPDQIARLIGILPNGPRDWNDHTPHTLFLRTNLSSVGRDPITGATPDVLIFLPGSCGTLCEMAFALQADRKVLLWKAVSKLSEKYHDHTRVDMELNDVLEEALKSCKTRLISVPGITSETTVATLSAKVKEYLAAADNFEGTPDQLIKTAIDLVGVLQPQSGFPGFRDDPQSQTMFEDIVERISN